MTLILAYILPLKIESSYNLFEKSIENAQGDYKYKFLIFSRLFRLSCLGIDLSCNWNQTELLTDCNLMRINTYWCLIV